jgi:hypothetical protein
MEALAGDVAAPTLPALEAVIDYGLSRGGCRDLADLWDVERLPACASCRERRTERLARLNVTGRAEPRVECGACTEALVR